MTENVRCAQWRRESSEPTAPALGGVPAPIDGTRETVSVVPFSQADAEDGLGRVVPATPEIARADRQRPRIPREPAPAVPGAQPANPHAQVAKSTRAIRPRSGRQVLRAAVPRGPIGSHTRTPRRTRWPVAGLRRYGSATRRKRDRRGALASRRGIPDGIGPGPMSSPEGLTVSGTPVVPVGLPLGAGGRCEAGTGAGRRRYAPARKGAALGRRRQGEFTSRVPRAR